MDNINSEIFSQEKGYELNSLLNHVFRDSEIGLIILDERYRLVIWNNWVATRSIIELDTVTGTYFFDIFPELRNSSLERALLTAIKNGMSSVISNSLNRKILPLMSTSGPIINQQLMVKPINLQDFERYCLIQISDVSAVVSREKLLLKQTNRAKALATNLVEEKERVQVTLNSIADAVIATDKQGFITSMNPVAEILVNATEQETLRKPVADVFKLISEHGQQQVQCPVLQCLEQLQIISNESDHVFINSIGVQYSITDSAAPIFDGQGDLLGAVLVFRDVSKSRALAAELNWQAKHDPLTGLANRRVFESRMGQLLENARLNEQIQHHLLYLDLDQFKVVNDTCGHDAGDELLKQVATTLQQRLRKTDLLARLGGDEFGVLLEHCDAEISFKIANTLRQAIQEFRFGWQAHSFKIGVSIGVAKITGSESKAAEILSAADSACYVAKEQGRNRIHFHMRSPSELSSQQKEMQWISRIQLALDENRFELYLQRIQDVSNLKTVSAHYEVLLRMISESGEMIPPGAFIPAAERFNLMPSIDRWVIDKVFSEIKSLLVKNNSISSVMIAINLSGASFMDEALLEHILLEVEKMPVSAHNFCFEVTETAAITKLDKATRFLSKIREKGCRIALDDFGSGLSSFAYLKTLPIDYLKIDGHFVKDIAKDPIDRAFVESINQIGHVMGLETIAEFVEDDKILDILSEIGVNYAQGYGIHKPCPFHEVF